MIHRVVYFLSVLLLHNTTHAFGQNILISDQNNPCEPSIMFAPENPALMVAGTLLNHVHVSTDSGRTWSSQILNSTYGVWGDPVIDVDSAGNFYYFHLSNPSFGNWIDRIVCQKSIDSGTTWSNGVGIGLVTNKEQDKQWSIIDKNKNNIYLTWTQFDNYGSANPNDSSIIRFSKSIDGGETFSDPIRISPQAGDCLDDDNTVEGAVPALGPNGEIYVSWAGPEGIVFSKSLDEGETWLSEEIPVNPMPGGWNNTIPGFQRTNGFPVTKCDLSGGPNHGVIYINWADQRNGSTDTDIWLARSADGGETWSEAIRVNDDTTTTHQFFTWMDIDQVNGNLYFVFYDRRNYPDLRTDVYMAISLDGGNSFINRKISESPFTPNSGVFFGDYNNIIAHDGIVRPIWTRLNQGQLSVWTDISPIELIITGENPGEKAAIDINNYPNPTDEFTYVSFKLRHTSLVDLELFDLKGNSILKIINNEYLDYGKFIYKVDLKKENIPAGSYQFILKYDDNVKVLRTIFVD